MPLLFLPFLRLTAELYRGDDATHQPTLLVSQACLTERVLFIMGIITNNAHSLALGFTFPFVCAAVVFVRFYMRRRRGNALLADDWLCLPAYACLLGLCITIIYCMRLHRLL